MPGVTVGDWSDRRVAFVVSDVAPCAIVGGNPAVVIKQRFSPPIVEDLEALRASA